MKILWLSRSIPVTQNSGELIYSRNLAIGLSKFTDKLTFCGLQIGGDLSAIIDCSAVDWQIVPGKARSPVAFFLSDLPMTSVRTATRNYNRLLIKQISSSAWSAIVIDQYFSAGLLKIIERSGYAGKIIYIAHNYETKLQGDVSRAFRGSWLLKLLYKENARRTAKAERSLISRSDLIVTLTESDAVHIRRSHDGANVKVIPPGYAGKRELGPAIGKETPKRVLLLGSLDWVAKQINLLEFLKVADNFFAKNDIEFRVVGRVPPVFLEQLPRNLKATTFVGYVEDTQHEFDSCRIGLVIDETGGGFKLKILEYIFRGLPIAGYRKALEGIEPELLIKTFAAETIHQLLELILEFIDDVGYLNELRHASFDFAKERYNWDDNGRQFYESISGIVD